MPGLAVYIIRPRFAGGIFFWLSQVTHKPEQLKGIVEAVEAFFRESFKGKRHGMTLRTRKRGTPASKRGLSSEQIPVLVCRDRSGCWHTCRYQGLSRTKCHSFDSRLKNWMHRFHGVATRYLSCYLG